MKRTYVGFLMLVCTGCAPLPPPGSDQLGDIKSWATEQPPFGVEEFNCDGWSPHPGDPTTPRVSFDLNASIAPREHDNAFCIMSGPMLDVARNQQLYRQQFRVLHVQDTALCMAKTRVRYWWGGHSDGSERCDMNGTRICLEEAKGKDPGLQTVCGETGPSGCAACEGAITFTAHYEGY
jgi:hypothetical protein